MIYKLLFLFGTRLDTTIAQQHDRHYKHWQMYIQHLLLQVNVMNLAISKAYIQDQPTI